MHFATADSLRHRQSRKGRVRSSPTQRSLSRTSELATFWRSLLFQSSQSVRAKASAPQ